MDDTHVMGCPNGCALLSLFILTDCSARNPERVTYPSQGCEPLEKERMMWGTPRGWYGVWVSCRWVCFLGALKVLQ